VTGLIAGLFRSPTRDEPLGPNVRRFFAARTFRQWVGRFFQRPEMHRIHHQYQRHRNNYGDLVIWDILFGTYENPPRVDCRCGFDPEMEERLPDMLLWRDVHATHNTKDKRP
jgi:sterol desaturase/sphingolipid hydroxylase (fatty acid hydroxylase superfamily)